MCPWQALSRTLGGNLADRQRDFNQPGTRMVVSVHGVSLSRLTFLVANDSRVRLESLTYVRLLSNNPGLCLPALNYGINMTV
jgi:hypothetical protein